jgi:abortive infection bacteriophage resistance protein
MPDNNTRHASPRKRTRAGFLCPSFVQGSDMKFTKPALTVDQQVELLVRRGMEIADTNAAKHFLSHVSYYRLRAYWLPNEAPVPAQGDHSFRPGTRFDTIVDLYSFDRKLRLLVMDAVERIEVSMRTRWAYVLSLRYGSHGFMDAKLFRNPKQHQKCLQ